MNIEIIKFDNLGRGIGYIDNKIIFIPKSVPGDIVNIEIIKNNSKYLEGKITEIIKPSKKRIEAICPLFNQCGGCDLLNITLSDSLEYKLRKINEILRKNNINYNVEEIIKSDKQYNYRNKVSLKVNNNKIGYYESKTHKLIEIEKCFLLNDEINRLIKNLDVLKIKNGNLIIRTNYHDELLLIIETNDKIEDFRELIEKFKISGIIVNKKVVYGSDYIIDKINNYLFKISYDSFFQINPYICSKLFDLIKENTFNSKNILDLYCGVGTLSINASENNTKVMGVEIVKDAIDNAIFNAKLNNVNNMKFICSDTKNIIDKITKDFDTVILDPPRSGVDILVLNRIIKEGITKIIYVSCDENTLVRDLNILLQDYNIKEFKLLDMFVNTEHVESFVVLQKKK